MLVLSRRKNESIVIGDGPNAVIVTVVETRGDKIRLGVTAPRDTPVYRHEVYDTRNQIDAADHTPTEIALGLAKAAQKR